MNEWETVWVQWQQTRREDRQKSEGLTYEIYIPVTHRLTALVGAFFAASFFFAPFVRSSFRLSCDKQEVTWRGHGADDGMWMRGKLVYQGVVRTERKEESTVCEGRDSRKKRIPEERDPPPEETDWAKERRATRSLRQEEGQFRGPSDVEEDERRRGWRGKEWGWRERESLALLVWWLWKDSRRRNNSPGKEDERSGTNFFPSFMRQNMKRTGSKRQEFLVSLCDFRILTSCLLWSERKREKRKKSSGKSYKR